MEELAELAEKDRILRNALLANLKNPNIVTNRTLIEVGANYFSQGKIDSLTQQTGLVTQHRPQDLEAYFQGLLDAGVPADIVRTQRAREIPSTSQKKD